jgi:hypothetical protein
MYIAMFVVVVLAAIGTVGVRSVQFEIATARNVRMGAQARYAADAGNMVSIGEFSGRYSSYRKWMAQNGQNWFEFDKDYFGAASTPVFADEIGTKWTALGYTDMEPGFLVRADQGVEMGDTEGYAVTGTTSQSFCFRKYTFTSLGTIMVDPAMVAPTHADNPGNSAETIRATTTIGPAVCGIQ